MKVMSWEEKLQALKELDPETCLCMRSPGNWYVSVKVREIGGDGLLRSSSGEGKTPEEAVNEDWRLMVEELPEGMYIVLNAYKVNRSQFRWGGSEWQSASVVEFNRNREQFRWNGSEWENILAAVKRR